MTIPAQPNGAHCALPLLFGKPVGRIHAVGVAGMGLGPLAVYLACRGWQVSGEDDALDKAPPELRTRLLEAGVALDRLPEDCELLVYSSAISQEHTALVSARARGVPTVRRGELLAEAVRDKRLVAVCGSHGKTTTTAMLAAALRRANFDAGYVLGGLPAQRSFPLAADADWVVAEVDESDGTIAHFAPEITVCVNLDWDHVDLYRSEAELHAAFGALFQRTKRAVLINADCALSRELAAKTAVASAQVFTFGKNREGGTAGDFSLKQWEEGREAQAGGTLSLALGGAFAISHAVLRATGAFNALNATAALAAAQLMGAHLSAALLADFPGVRRRQSLISDLGGVRMIEDYAHHPAEIRALLTELRHSVSSPSRPEHSSHPSRLLVVFQPHRYSRTAQFKRELAEALSLADAVFLIDVYGAGEAPSAGASSAELLSEFSASSAVHYCADKAALFNALDAAACASGDCLAFVGAGDVDRKGRAWAAQWRARWWDALAAEARARLSPDTKLAREEPLARKSTMLVGGTARLYAEPQTVAELQALLRLAGGAGAHGVPVFPIGRGSNLIIPDEGVEGLVISLGHANWATFELCELGEGEGAGDAGAGGTGATAAVAATRKYVRVGAGLRLKNLCGLAAKAGLPGFEFLEGIPGSVGGALRMNAGAMGTWIFDVVEEVEFVTFDGELVRRRASELHVGYRHCAELASGALALGAVLRSGVQAEAGAAAPVVDAAEAATRAASEAVSRQIDVYRKKRVESQPREPSAGCIFKNPEGGSAGRLIDAAGLKGLRVGGAEVSAVHANFIVNKAHATAGEVLELVRQVRARVHAAHGVWLEPEARLFGRDWAAWLAEVSPATDARVSGQQRSPTASAGKECE